MNVQKWDVWLAELKPVVGSEQGRRRPVVVLSENHSNNVLPVFNALPVTSRKNNRPIFPNEVLLPAGKAGLPNESVVLCYQIRTLDKQRILKFYGTLDDTALQQAIYRAVRFQFGIR